MNIIRIDDMTIAKIRLGDVRHNPFRRFDEFPLIEKKVAALQNSIQETGFLDNVLGRIVEGGVEIAYGHHRIEAAKRVYGEDHEIGITIRELSDVGMAMIMGLENSEEWMNPVQHHHQVVENARSFFDSWFERFPTWGEFRDAVLQNRIKEFGVGWDVGKIEKWFGGTAEKEQCYNQSLLYGVGRDVLSRFTSIPESECGKVLRVKGPSKREKIMLARIEEERRQADELLAEQREAELQAQREKDVADRQAKEAEDIRRKQAAIARNVADEEKKKVAQAEADKQSAIREAAKKERDAADKRAKAAEKAQRESEKKAKEANQAEQQKRKAAAEQERYDQAATFVWEKHDHAAEFRRLCLLPGTLDILAKDKQAEFAAYLKGYIPGEVTTDKLRQYFEAEMKSFISGVRKQRESDNPLFELERRFEEIKSKSTSLAISCSKVMEKIEQLNITDVGGMGAYEVHFKTEALLESLVRFYAKLGLRSDYLVQQKAESQPVVKLLVSE